MARRKPIQSRCNIKSDYVIQEPTVIDFSLEWELGCIAILLDYDEELCDAFFAAQRDDDVMAALQRQKVDGAAATLRTVTSVAFHCL